jgi:hypothetical protein
MVVRFDLHILLHGTLLAAWAASPRLVASRLALLPNVGCMARLKTKTPNKPWGVCVNVILHARACRSLTPALCHVGHGKGASGRLLQRRAHLLLCFVLGGG